MSELNCHGNPADQKGVALIMTIIVLLILTLLGLSLVLTSGIETKVNNNFRSSTQAYFAAEAGIEEGIYRLKSSAVNPITPTSIDATSKVLYIRATASVDPTNSSSADYDAEYSSSSFSTASFVLTNQTANALPYRWVKISIKSKRNSGQDVNNTGLATNQDAPVYYDTSEYLYDPAHNLGATRSGNPVYQLTSFARTSDGAVRIARAEVSKNIVIGNLPAALMLNGPAPSTGMPNSNNFVIDGTDQGGSGFNVPAIGVVTNGDIALVSGTIPNNRKSHYTGLGGTTPDIENLSASLPPGWNTVQGMEDLASSAASNATAVYASSATTAANWGTAANPVINVFNGDCNLGNNTGYGVLVVYGNLHMQGNGGFNGLILVIGQGSFDFNGGGNGAINGGMLLARTRDASGNLLGSLGSPSVAWNGGGGNGVRYNKGLINSAFSNSAWKHLAFKEITP